MKKILKVFLYFVLFFVLQIFGTAFAIFYKTYFDTEWAVSFLNAINNLNTESMNEYLNLCYELIPSMMFFCFILGVVPFFIVAIRKKNEHIKLISNRSVVKTLSCAVSLNLLISVIILLIPQNIQNNYNSSIGYIETIPTWSLLISIGLFAPFIEEIFFRYFMVGILKEKKVLAIILPALIFGIAHGNSVQGTYAFILGVIFAVIYLKTDNLLYTILLHIGINSSSVIFEGSSCFVNLAISVFCIIVTIGFLYEQYKKIPHNILKLIWLYKKDIKKIWKEINSTQNNYELVRRMSKEFNKKLELEVIVKGREYLRDLKEPFIAYSNHRGMYDPILITSQMNQNLSYVLKKELMKVKFLDKVVEITNSEYFGRTPKEDLKTIVSMIDKNKNGRNYLIFPEGTRNTNKTLLEFKAGSFKIPQKTHCDILPIALYYTENVFEENYKDKKLVIHYLPAIHYEDYKEMNSLELAKYVQEEIQDVINDILAYRY